MWTGEPGRIRRPVSSRISHSDADCSVSPHLIDPPGIAHNPSCGAFVLFPSRILPLWTTRAAAAIQGPFWAAAVTRWT